jgi:hypothetical protein
LKVCPVRVEPTPAPHNQTQGMGTTEEVGR